MSTDEYVCDKCNKKCKDKRGLTLHYKKCEGIKALVCEYCNDEFANPYSLSIHFTRCKILKKHKQEEELTSQQQEEKLVKGLTTENTKLQDKIKELENKYNQLVADKAKEILTLKNNNRIDLERQLKLRDTDLQTLHKEMETQSRDIRVKDQEILALKEDLKDAKIERRNMQALMTRLSMKETTMTIITQNNNDNRVQLQTLDPSLIQGRIDPPDFVIGSVNDLMNMLRCSGVRNCFRVNDKSRGTLCWNKPGEGEVRDPDGEQLLCHIIDSLTTDLIKEKSYYEEELKKLYDQEPKDLYRINDAQLFVSFCTRLLKKDPELLRKIKKALVDHGKKKGDTDVDKIYDITYSKFINSITISLFPNVYEWIEMSFYDLGRYIGTKIKDIYHTEGASRELLYIVIHDDENYNKQVNSKQLITYITESVSHYIEDELIEQLLSTLVLQNKSIDSAKAEQMLRYLKSPSIEDTTEIMRGIVSL